MNYKMLTAVSTLLLATACSDSSNTASTQQSDANKSAAAPASAACGKVSIAEMNWNSAALMAQVDAFVLEHGYGCDVELVAGDTMPTGTSMIEKGQPDVAPEMWSNSLREALDKGVAEGRLRYAGDSLSDGGEEGFWVPEYMVKADPTLATIAGVKAAVKQFKHPEDPEKSMFMGCPAGWNCQISARNLFTALDLDKTGFSLVDPGSGAAMAGAIAKAYERSEPWFGYYWAPTAILGKYKMVKVDFGSGIDKDHYMNCISKEDCAEPRATMYPPSSVQTVVTESFASASPAAYDYFTKRSYTNVQMNGLLAWMEDNQADGKIAAEEFMKTQRATWSAWVSDDIAKKVDAAIAAM